MCVGECTCYSSTDTHLGGYPIPVLGSEHLDFIAFLSFRDYYHIYTIEEEVL